ncbi:unnamed protein product, partial [Oppiella nova]
MVKDNNDNIVQRDDMNDKIIDFEVRGLNVEVTEHNIHVPNAKAMLETIISECMGKPYKDIQEMSNGVTLSFPNITNQDELMRDDMNDKIIDFEVRGLNVEVTEHNIHVPNAKAMLETIISECMGKPYKDIQEMSNGVTLSFPNITNQDELM